MQHVFPLLVPTVIFVKLHSRQTAVFWVLLFGELFLENDKALNKTRASSQYNNINDLHGLRVIQIFALFCWQH